MKLVKVVEKVVLAAVVLALAVIAIAALLFAPVVVVKAEAEEFTVSGYGPGEFAVKGEVERQTEKMIKGWVKKRPVEITVQGFADKTGETAKNDTIARDRAEQILYFLEQKTDATRIAAISKGDSENVRKVVVAVEFAPPLVVKTKRSNIVKKSVNSWLFFLKIITIILIILAGFFFLSFSVRLFYKPKQKIDNGRKKIDFKSMASKPALEEWVEVGGYSVRITSVGGLWYSPFSSLLGGTFITKWSRSSLISSIKRCLVNPKFSEQIRILQEKGWIKAL